MIHGHTRIKMYNPLSGNILRDVESDNTFQDTVIAKALRNLGECHASILNNSTFKGKDYWKETLGGILLFKEAISGDNTSFMSAGNSMTANGATDVVNASNPPELGSYDDVESKIVIEAKKKLILQYAWGQSQGNGKISSCCLTSRTGGLIGYGNASGYRKTESVYTDYYTLNRLADCEGADSASPSSYQAIAVGNYKYTFYWDNGLLAVDKKKICITTGSVFDLVKTTTKFDLSQIGNPLSWTSQDCYVTASEGKIYVVPNRDQSSVSVNGTFYFYIYDTETDTLTLKSMTNNSSKSIMVRGFNNSYFFGVSHGIVFVASTGQGNTIEGFRLSDNVHVCSKQVTASGYEMAGNRFMIGDLPNGLTLVTNRETSQNNYECFIYDATNDTLYPINAENRQIQSTLYTGFIYDEELDAMVYNKSGYVTAFNNPLYLATKNNFTSVVKSADMAMTVTYTLEEE